MNTGFLQDALVNGNCAIHKFTPLLSWLFSVSQNHETSLQSISIARTPILAGDLLIIRHRNIIPALLMEWTDLFNDIEKD
jgi:hypothetical protein